MHIRADVLTKTRYGKSRDNKVSYGSTIPKTQRKKTTTVNESKEYFSENDLCYGGNDFDCEYEDDYEDDGEDGQCANGQRGDDDDDWVEQTDHCKRNRHRNKYHDNRATRQNVRRDPKTAGDGRRRPISRDKTTAKSKTAAGNAETSATAAAAAAVAVQHGTAAATDGVTADAPPDFVHSDQHADVPSNLPGDVGRDEHGVQ